MRKVRFIIRSEKRRNPCLLCHRVILTNTDREFRRHQQNCEGLFRFYCRVCKRWRTWPKPEIGEHLRGHGMFVDVDKLNLKPVVRKEKVVNG